jgi:hypothetical protein
MCPRCGKKRYTRDEALDVADTSRSPGVRRQVSRLGARETFQEVSRDMAELAGIALLSFPKTGTCLSVCVKMLVPTVW